MSRDECSPTSEARSATLPDDILFKLCMDLATDPSRSLGTLSSRLHALAALGSVCRDLRDFVWDHALPRMQSLCVDHGELMKHRGRPFPTDRLLALMTDEDVYLLAFEVCELVSFKRSMMTGYSPSDERRFYVDLLWIASHFWDFMPLVLVAYNTDGRI